MCKVLKVSRSGYYYWLKRRPSRWDLENGRLIVKIRQIHQQSNQTYGSPRITMQLRDQQIKVSRPRVARLMKTAGIRSKIVKKFRVTTDSKHNYPIVENKLNRNFKVERTSQVWVSDITYIWTSQGWLYLTIIMDLADRKIIGWALSNSLKVDQTIIPAWRMAVINRPIDQDLVFHSDRGVQYCCCVFASFLETYQKVSRSMSRKGDCWDNAVAESFFKTIKSELIYHYKFGTWLQAKRAIFEYIEMWYNRKRKHSALGYLSPVEYELKLLQIRNVA